jgi:hypothetical protein
MKKLIAIAVVFVLVAGAAFADISVSGAAGGKVIVGEGHSNSSTSNAPGAVTTESGDNTVAGAITDVKIEASAQNEDGTFGGAVRLFTWGGWGGGIMGRANAWWKPIEQLRLQVGSGLDGSLGFDNILGWGFYESAGGLMVYEDANKYDPRYGYNSLYGGAGDGAGLLVTLTPIPALEFNVFVPFGRNGTDPWETYAKTHLMITYGIDNIGKFALSYAGDTYGFSDDDVISKEGHPAKMYAAFDLTAIEGLEVIVGATFAFPLKNEAEAGGYKVTTTYSAPVYIGLGAKYNAGAFGIKARFEMGFGGLLKTEYSAIAAGTPALATNEAKGGTTFNFDLLPSYALNDSFKIFLAGGLAISAPDKDPADNNTVEWHFNPYITISGGSGTFWAGVQLAGKTNKTTILTYTTTDTYFTWGIPIGITFSL